MKTLLNYQARQDSVYCLWWNLHKKEVIIFTYLLEERWAPFFQAYEVI